MNRLFCAVMALALSLSFTAHAEDMIEQKLELQNHTFMPKTLEVPSGKKIKLLISNKDASAAEFESYALHREKVIAANGNITVFVGPLAAGSYDFFDDFHHDTTSGSLIAK